MSAASVPVARLVPLLMLLACGRQPPPGEGKENPTVLADTASDSVVDTSSARRPAVRPGAPTNEALDRPIPVPGKKQKAALSVNELLDNVSVAGTVVTVRGTCLRRGVGRAQGAPPLTRSDWELGDGTKAVWVSGPRPVDCPAESGAKDSSMVRGLVQADTLRMFDGSEQVRVYLVVEP
jgi:hypothetical protein